MSGAAGTELRAIYYPFSRTLSEVSLKRAVMLYDETIFIDPVSQRVRDGLYDVDQHNHYLPRAVATGLYAEWETVRASYGELERRGIVRFVEPARWLALPGADALIATALSTELASPDVGLLFRDGYPRLWSMLRSRIPAAALTHLEHQQLERVVSRGSANNLVMDGHPSAVPGQRTPDDDGREYAMLLPYAAGSSIATTTALMMALAEDAVPMTDSDAHFRLLSLRLARAAAAVPAAADLPGLVARPSAVSAQKAALVHQRIVDSVISHADWEQLTLVQCLEYRDHTAEERLAFREFLADIVRSTSSEPWSPQLEAEIQDKLLAARHEVSQHAAELRETYRTLFKRTLIGLSVAAAPAVITAICPFVSPLTALLLGGGPLTALLSDPLKDVLEAWAGRRPSTNSLAYLMDLPRTSSARAGG